MGLETPGYDEYGSSMPPETPGEYDRIIDSIDMRMAPDTGAYEPQGELTEDQVIANAIGSLGLGEPGQNDMSGEMVPSGNETQVYTQGLPTETPEIPTANKPVVEVIEPSSTKPVETAEVAKVKVAGCECVPSSISSGFVYDVSDNVTPEMDRANRQIFLDMRQELEALGRPFIGEDCQLIDTARKVIAECGELLGVDVKDRLPPATSYRLIGPVSEYLAGLGRIEQAGESGRSVALSEAGVGIVVDENAWNGYHEAKRLFVLTHETAHQAFRDVIHPSVTAKLTTKFTPYLTGKVDEKGNSVYWMGLRESVVDLIAMRSLRRHIGPSFSSVDSLKRHSAGLSYTTVDILLHGAIEKAAEHYGQHPREVADAIAIGALTGGDREKLSRLVLSFVQSVGDLRLFIRTTGHESYNEARDIACRLGLPGAVDLIDNWRQGSQGKIFDWQ